MKQPDSEAFHPNHSPAQLRGIFGRNLRALCNQRGTVSEVCRNLGINRAQFNRYLSSDSFPRPDVLFKICTFFEVDGRILYQPLEELTNTQPDLVNHPELKEFFGPTSTDLPEHVFPSGFYRFVRRSFMSPNRYVLGLVYVYRDGPYSFVRGYETRNSMRALGLPAASRSREFRGYLMHQENGVAMMASRRDALTSTFNYLNRVSAFHYDTWVGYAVRTSPETISGSRATRMLYEFLGANRREIMQTAREAGIHDGEDLLPYHMHLLRPHDPFS